MLLDLDNYSFYLYYAEIHEFEELRASETEADSTEENTHQNENISENISGK